MNCQDITDILDDRDIAGLGDAQRGEVEAHLHQCTECAHDWAAHQRLLAVAIPATAVALAARCRALVAAQTKVGTVVRGRRRSGSRLILIGTLVAVAAAAALLSAVLRNSNDADATLAVAAPAPPAQPLPVAAEIPAAVEVVSPVPAPVEPKKKAVPLPESPRFTVRVLPLQDRTTDESSRQAVKSFYAALLDGLRAVPGLTLIESAASGGTIPAGEFQLAVTGSGTVQGRWNALTMLKVDMAVSDDRQARRAIVPHVLQYSGVVAPACGTTTPGRLAVDCSDPEGGATLQIDLMRQVAFPPDPLLRQRLLARLQDRTLDPQQRWNALESLRVSRPVVVAGPSTPKLTEERPALDVETVRGAIDLAASTSSPLQRAQIWSVLRGARQPELIQPLIDSSRLDPSDATRLEAVATLAADYSQNDKARAALDSIALNDSRELVRMVARRVLSGDAAWNEYAAARLHDTSLPDAQRLEALSYMASTVARDQSAQLQDLLDARAVQALAQIMPRALAALPDPSVQRGPDTDSLMSLSRMVAITNQPATIDLLTGMLRASSDPMVRRMAVTGLARHMDDARVRSVLDDVAANDPDPNLRDQARVAQPQLATPPPGT